MNKVSINNIIYLSINNIIFFLNLREFRNLKLRANF